MLYTFKRIIYTAHVFISISHPYKVNLQCNMYTVISWRTNKFSVVSYHEKMKQSAILEDHVTYLDIRNLLDISMDRP